MDENWDRLPNDEIIEKTADEMRKRNFEVDVVNNRVEALQKLLSIISDGSSVMNGSSTTLQEIGFIDYLKNNPDKWTNLHIPILKEKDVAKGVDLRRQSLLADYFLASANAISEEGVLFAVDQTGTRTGAFPFAAKHLVLVVGINKVSKDFETSMRRIREYVLPKENERALKAYGTGSSIGKWAIIEKEKIPGRIKVILVKEKLGF